MKKSKNKLLPEVSIIVPAYNEETAIKETLEKLKSVMDKMAKSYEIICVVDGSGDQTAKIARSFSKSFPKNFFVYSYKINKGKGFALRLGFRKAKGEIIGFIDADGQISPKSLARAVKIIKNSGEDIVIGSKSHPESKVKYSFSRKMISLVSKSFIKLLFGIKVKDTQAGLKCFKAAVIDSVEPKLTARRWGLDIEILALAKLYKFKDPVEVPIQVKEPKRQDGIVNERVSFFDLFYTFFEVLLISFRLKFLTSVKTSRTIKL